MQRQRGLPSDSEEEEEEGATAKAPSKPQSRGAPGDLPPSDSEEESDSGDEVPRNSCSFVVFCMTKTK